jgi:hypothetical protein
VHSPNTCSRPSTLHSNRTVFAEHVCVVEQVVKARTFTPRIPTTTRCAFRAAMASTLGAAACLVLTLRAVPISPGLLCYLLSASLTAPAVLRPNCLQTHTTVTTPTMSAAAIALPYRLVFLYAEPVSIFTGAA